MGYMIKISVQRYKKNDTSCQAGRKSLGAARPYSSGVDACTCVRMPKMQDGHLPGLFLKRFEGST